MSQDMEKKIKKITFLILTLLVFSEAKAQDRKWDDIDTTAYYKKHEIIRKRDTIVFINTASEFDTVVQNRMIGLFFEVYPKEAKRFNKNAPRKVTFVVTTEYQGVAATWGTLIKFNPKWLEKNPEDIDCATHELMHVVQAYHGYNNPSWLVEGIADYARNVFGINNKKANWELTPYKTGQTYTNAYRITARFLTWVEKRYNKNLVKKLNTAMRENLYTENLWIKLTGRSVDELWYLYTQDPTIT
jgi:hypothetical protein